MANFNKVILLGNLTRDPEMRYTPAGVAVAGFSIAINRKTKQNGEWKTEVDYFDIVVWDNQGENCGQYLHKGDAALIEGRLQQRRWVTDGGENRSKVEVVAQSVTFMPKKQGSGDKGQGAGVPGPVGNAFPDATPVNDDEIPF